MIEDAMREKSSSSQNNLSAFENNQIHSSPQGNSRKSTCFKKYSTKKFYDKNDFSESEEAFDETTFKTKMLSE